MIDVDVLIVGGGAQGLWLLNDLTNRHYKAILLERHELGGGQTCHSHGLIHRGHYYEDVDMMIVLNASAEFWQAFCNSKGLKKINPERAVAGFGAGSGKERLTSFWRDAGLKFNRSTKLPPVLQGGKVRTLYETDEFTLDTNALITALARDLEHSIYKVDEPDGALKFVCKDSKVHSVEASLGGNSFQIAPRLLVLTAGVGNRQLLAQLGGDTAGPGPDKVPVQSQRMNHMMVLRGDGLPLMTAVFPESGGLPGVFLCPRKDLDTGQHVWLVSDHRSSPFKIPPDGTSSPEPTAEWIKYMLTELDAVTPGVLSDDVTRGLEVAVYTGLKSERNLTRGQRVTDFYIESLGFENVLTIWPTKLTMTPFASNVAMRFVRAEVPEPSGEWPDIGRPIVADTAKVAPEMWRRNTVKTSTEQKTSWLPYADFLKAWQVPRPGAGGRN